MTTYSYNITLTANEFADVLNTIGDKIRNVDALAINYNELLIKIIKGFDKQSCTYTFSFSDRDYFIIKESVGESFWERTKEPVMTSTSSSCWTEFDKE